MNNTSHEKFKIIEVKTAERAEYEINNFIEHCRQNNMETLDVKSHVNTDATGNYRYTFIVKYSKNNY